MSPAGDQVARKYRASVALELRSAISGKLNAEFSAEGYGIMLAGAWQTEAAQ